MGLFTSIFGDGSAANGKTPEQLDAELAALQAKRAKDNPEKFGGSYQEAFDAHLDLQMEQDRDIEGQLQGEFNAGLEDGAKNISGAIGGVFNVIGKGLKGVLFGIPGWAWLIAAGVAFFYFGGGPILKNLIKKKVKA